MRVDLTFPPLWSFLRQQPAHEQRFLAVGNTDMPPTISERTEIAVIGSFYTGQIAVLNA